MAAQVDFTNVPDNSSANIDAAVNTQIVHDSNAAVNEQVVLILVGLVGSGKSTFAEALETFFPDFRRCNQDDLGNRRKVEALAVKTLRQGLSVCIDRTNIDESQREHFINIARTFPNSIIWALVFETPYEDCATRLQSRINHPTITSAELGLSILERFKADYYPPTAQEGFDRIKLLKPHSTGVYTRDEIAAILDDIRKSPSLQPTSSLTPSLTLQFFRGDNGRGGRVPDRNGWNLSPSAISGHLNIAGREGRYSGSSPSSWRKGSKGP